LPVSFGETLAEEIDKTENLISRYVGKKPFFWQIGFKKAHFGEIIQFFAFFLIVLNATVDYPATRV
jgi:hypothetical protein